MSDNGRKKVRRNKEREGDEKRRDIERIGEGGRIKGLKRKAESERMEGWVQEGRQCRGDNQRRKEMVYIGERRERGEEVKCTVCKRKTATP